MDEQFGKEILNLMLYGGHPYGHHPAGTVETVTGITLEDVKAFYKEHAVQGNVKVVPAAEFFKKPGIPG